MKKYCMNTDVNVIDHGVNLDKFKASTEKGNSFVVCSQLIERNTLLADFKAVQNGRVYCTGADYFQQAGRLGDLIEDMNRMLSGDDAALNHIMKLE